MSRKFFLVYLDENGNTIGRSLEGSDLSEPIPVTMVENREFSDIVRKHTIWVFEFDTDGYWDRSESLCMIHTCDPESPPMDFSKSAFAFVVLLSCNENVVKKIYHNLCDKSDSDRSSASLH